METIRVLEQARYDAEDVGLYESWDVTASRGDELLHIEVKGSSAAIDQVILTRNEVIHAREFGATTLVVIDQIHVAADLDCSGGRWRVFSRWSPEPGALLPLAYRYVLPPGGSDSLPVASANDAHESTG